MRKNFKLEDLDCANCAAKMEEKIKKLEGVEFASVSFMTATLTVEAAEEDFEKLLKLIQKTIKKIEPDCRLVV